MEDDRVGDTVDELLEVSLGSLAPIEDWSRRHIAMLPHYSLAGSKLMRSSIGFIPTTTASSLSSWALIYATNI